jgi:hypothetical protein
LAAVLTIYLVRALGPPGYGVFALAVGLGSLLTLPSDFGISSSTARFVAEHRGDRRVVAALVGDAFRLKLVIALVVCAGLFAGADLIASAYDNPSLAWPLKGVAVALFGQNLMMLFAGTFVALSSSPRARSRRSSASGWCSWAGERREPPSGGPQATSSGALSRSSSELDSWAAPLWASAMGPAGTCGSSPATRARC